MHISLVHGLGIALEALRIGAVPGWLIGDYGACAEPTVNAGFALLHPLCAWFAGLKQRRRDAWLSYF